MRLFEHDKPVVVRRRRRNAATPWARRVAKEESSQELIRDLQKSNTFIQAAIVQAMTKVDIKPEQMFLVSPLILFRMVSKSHIMARKGPLEVVKVPEFLGFGRQTPGSPRRRMGGLNPGSKKRELLGVHSQDTNFLSLRSTIPVRLSMSGSPTSSAAATPYVFISTMAGCPASKSLLYRWLVNSGNDAPITSPSAAARSRDCQTRRASSAHCEPVSSLQR